MSAKYFRIQPIFNDYIYRVRHYAICYRVIIKSLSMEKEKEKLNYIYFPERILGKLLRKSMKLKIRAILPIPIFYIYVQSKI